MIFGAGIIVLGNRSYDSTSCIDRNIISRGVGIIDGLGNKTRTWRQFSVPRSSEYCTIEDRLMRFW